MKKHRSRPSPDRMVEDARWVKDKRGQWRHEIDAVSEVGYCARRREKNGWHKGARVRGCTS